VDAKTSGLGERWWTLSVRRGDRGRDRHDAILDLDRPRRLRL